MLASLVCLLAAGLPLVAGQFENKYNLLTGGNVMDEGLKSSLRNPGYTLQRWTWGTVPQKCLTTLVNNNNPQYCHPYSIEVFDVTFDDCGASYLICRCNNSPMSVDAFATSIGRIPARMRQWTRVWMNAPTVNGGGGNAWTDRTDLMLFGDLSQSVFLHETGHNVDFWVGGQQRQMWSEQSEYVNAVAADTCVLDQYAKSNYRENFAQVFVAATFDVNVRSFVSAYNGQCMSRALSAAIGMMSRDQLRHVPENRCTVTISRSNTPAVCMGPAARESGNCNGVSGFAPPTEPEVPEGVELLSAEFPPEVQKMIDEEMEEKRRIMAEIWQSGENVTLIF